MRIERWFELKIKNDTWRTVMQKSLIHELPNGLQFYNIPNGYSRQSIFLVDKDMQILCRIYTNQDLDLFIEER